MSGASPAVAALVALMQLKGIGRSRALQLLGAPPHGLTADDCRDGLLKKAEEARLSQADLLEAWKRSIEQLHAGAEIGVRAVSFHDDGYPARLKHMPDPPAVLYIRGKMEALHEPRSVAIVGTREPTPYGVEVARRSGAAAARAGFVIVSGLAHGCDTFAHEGCLDVGGIGVAVMAHGLDKVYPAANRGLAERLLEGGGCLVSEYPLGMTPARTAFADRDRIQSGLADGVLVVETDVKGGTMHTVRFARKQDRVLACIAHPEKWSGENKTRGNAKLIADGWAQPIPDSAALLRFIEETAKTGDASGRDESRRQVPRPRTPKQEAWAF